MGGDRVLETLKQYFGFNGLRAGQKQATDAALCGSDSLVVMATGAGKSICYQLPALLEAEGVVVVISPLISLMHDQVSGLAARNIPAVTTANDSYAEQEALGGRTKLVYTTPETALGRWKDKLLRLHEKVGVKLLAVDEAHCVSEWGHDFRPEYQRLAELRLVLPGVPVMALTATATPDVQREIIKNLRLRGAGGGEPVKVVTTFDRPNLHYIALERSEGALEAVFQPLVDSVRQGVHEPVIVYALTQKETERLVASIRALGMPPSRVAFYHAGMGDGERTRVHDAFLHDTLSVVVATTAFGMGVDKPDVRHVVHWGVPKTLESYYQQSGRAGRDGIASRCVLLYNGRDFGMASFYEQGADGRIISETARKALHDGMLQIKKYCYSTRCRREILLAYFGDAAPGGGKGCGMCDNCERRRAGGFQEEDVEAETRQVLEAVRVCGGRYGIMKYVGFIKGLSTAPEACKGKPGYNSGAAHSSEYWKALALQLLSLKPPLLQEVQRVGGGWNGSKQQTFKIVTLSSEGERFLSYHPKGQPFLMALPDEMRARAPAAKPAASAAKRRVSSNEATAAPTLGPAAGSPSGRQQLQPKKIGGAHAFEDEEEEELYTRLLKVRQRLAKDEGVPLAHVCDENTLVALTSQRPSSMDNLCRVHGAHNKFVERHGRMFVDAIVAFCAQPFMKIQLDGFRSGSAAKNSSHAGGGRVLPGCMTRMPTSFERKLSVPYPPLRQTSPPTSRKPHAHASTDAGLAGGGGHEGHEEIFMSDVGDDFVDAERVGSGTQPGMDAGREAGAGKESAPHNLNEAQGGDRTSSGIEVEYVDEEELAMYEQLESEALAASAAAAASASHQGACSGETSGSKKASNNGPSRPSVMEWINARETSTDDDKGAGNGATRRPTLMEWVGKREELGQVVDVEEEGDSSLEHAEESSQGADPVECGSRSQAQGEGSTSGNGVPSFEKRGAGASPSGNAAAGAGKRGGGVVLSSLGSHLSSVIHERSKVRAYADPVDSAEVATPSKKPRLSEAGSQASSALALEGQGGEKAAKAEPQPILGIETSEPIGEPQSEPSQPVGQLGSISLGFAAKIRRTASLKKALTQSELRKVIARYHGRSVEESELLKIFGVQSPEERGEFDRLVLALIEEGDILRETRTRLVSA